MPSNYWTKRPVLGQIVIKCPKTGQNGPVFRPFCPVFKLQSHSITGNKIVRSIWMRLDFVCSMFGLSFVLSTERPKRQRYRQSQLRLEPSQARNLKPSRARNLKSEASLEVVSHRWWGNVRMLPVSSFLQFLQNTATSCGDLSLQTGPPAEV